MNAIEERVEALNALRSRARQLDDYMRRMRLGAKPGLAVRGLWWQRMVFGFGYFEQKVEPLPAGMERDFYSFLLDKAEDLGVTIREEEASLDSVQEPSNSGEAS